MFRILVDTCVWLDLAKDPKQHAVLGVVEEMRKQQLISLLVPSVLIDEFKRNRARIEKDSAKSLSTHFKVVKEAIGRAGGGKRSTKTVLAHLDDLDHKIPIMGGSATGALDRIEKLLTSASPVELSVAAKLRAADRALSRKAPFHRERNSMGDALLIEMYAECAAERMAGVRFAFVTHNKNDFSDPTNFKQPHPDLKDLFSRVKSLYFINLVEALRRVDPTFVSETMFDLSWEEEPRGLHEILEAEDRLMHQVWYNRHWNTRIGIEKGTIKLVDRLEQRADGSFKYEQNEILRDVWRGAIAAQKEMEKTLGKENIGPWTDFEWGMLNGKLSALRWVLGSEWDMLDT